MEFRKRHLKRPADFFNMLSDFSTSAFKAFALGRGERIPPAFAEKIMLAVTGVNECIYCSYSHTRSALARGVEEAEIKKLLAGEIGDFSEDEAVALAYAQHWAETSGDVSADARQRMIDYYGEKKTLGIEAFIKMVSFGNMCSNTVEAKKAGVDEKNSSAFRLAYFLAAPIAFGVRTHGRYKD